MLFIEQLNGKTLFLSLLHDNIKGLFNLSNQLSHFSQQNWGTQRSKYTFSRVSRANFTAFCYSGKQIAIIPTFTGKHVKFLKTYMETIIWGH